MNVPPLQSLLDHPDYQTLDPDKKVEAIRNWEQDEIKRRNQSGDWDIESRALFEVQTRQARQAALGIEPQSPEAILQGVAEDEADPEDVRIWDSLAEVHEAERQQREINRRRVIPWLREENDAELLATAEGKIEAVKSREGDLDIEMARLGAEALQGKRDAAVVRGKLVVNPELYYDRERFVSVVNASAATDREKARVLSGFYRGREETAKAALPRLEGVGAFRDFARSYVQENPDVTNGDVVEAFRKSDAGEFDKWYEAVSTGFLSAMEGVGYLGFAAAELPKLAGRAANAVGLESFGDLNTRVGTDAQSSFLAILGETGAAKAQSAEKVAALGGYSTAQEYGQVGGQLFGQIALTMLSGGTSLFGAGAGGVTKQAVASEVGKRLGVGGLAKKWTLERAKMLVSPAGIIAGASGGGPALYEAYERNRKKLASEGLAGPELEEQARGAAFLDASRTAVTTAVITSLFGFRGTEGIARLTQAAGSQAARQAIAKTAKERWVSAGLGALSEGVEEAIDEGVNGGLDALLENPDMTFEDWEKATLFAGSAGLLFGGATEAFVNLAEARAERIRNSPEMAARQQQVSDLRASGLNQTADALEADNAAVEAQAVSDAIDDIEARAAGAINRLDEIDTEVNTLSRTPGNEARIEELVAEREQLNEILAAGQQNLRNYDPVATANVAVADVVAEGIEPEEARRRVTEVINTRHRGVPVAPETLVSEALAMETPTTTPTTDEEGMLQTTQAETVTPGQTPEVIAAAPVSPVTPVKAEPTFRAIAGRPALVDNEAGDIRIDEDGTVLLDRGADAPPIIVSRNPDAVLSTSEFDVRIDEETEMDVEQARVLRTTIGGRPTPRPIERPAPASTFVRDDGAIVTSFTGQRGPVAAVTDFVSEGETEAGDLFVTVRDRDTGNEFELHGNDALEVALARRDRARDTELTEAITAALPEPVIEFDRVLSRLLIERPNLLEVSTRERRNQRFPQATLDAALDELTSFNTSIENENLPADIRARLTGIVDDAFNDLASVRAQPQPSPAPTPARGTDEAGSPAGGRTEETAPLPPAEPAVAETGVTPEVTEEPAPVTLADDVVDTAWAATEGNPEARAELEAVMTPEQRTRLGGEMVPAVDATTEPEAVAPETPAAPDDFAPNAVPLDASPTGSVEGRGDQDTAYLAAVERGDMETAQRMVDEAARAAGYVIGKAFHATKHHRKITKFITTARDALGAHFGLTRRQAVGPHGRFRRIGNGVSLYEVYLKASNPIRLEDRGTWSSDRVVPQINDALASSLAINSSRSEIVSFLRQSGYDSAIYENLFEGKEGDEAIIIFDPNQIKSADPVTLSAQGNVIPLSRRFNPASDSILETSPASFTLDSDWQEVTNVLLDRAIAKYPKIPVTKDATIPAPARTMGLRILVNPEELARYTNGMEPEDAAEMIEKIFIHEAAHRHAVAEVGADFVNDYAARMTVDERVDVAMQYLHPSAYPTTEAYLAAVNDFAAVDPALPEGERRLRYFRLGHEALRMNVERFRTGFTTEETLAFLQTNPGNLARFVRYLRSYLNRLGEWFRLRKDPALGVEVKRLSKVLDTLTKGETIPRGPAPFDPNRSRVVRMGGKGFTVEPPSRALDVPAYHGTPHQWAPETLWRLSDGRTEWIIDGEPVPSGSTMVRKAPAGRVRADKVGSGEGAAAYGWGVLYAAEDEAVAKNYREVLSRDQQEVRFRFDGGDWSSRDVISLVTSEEDAILGTLAQDLAKRKDGSLTGAVEDFRKELEESGGKEKFLRVLQSLVDRNLVVEKAPSPDAGALLSLDLKVDQELLLDWDKPLSEQSERVREALRFAGIVDLENKGDAKLTGSDIYGDTGYSDSRTRSEFLLSLGIQGIRYLDGNSRNRPFRDLRNQFLSALPEDAEFEDVRAELAEGTFNSDQSEFLRALEADDWLGFDYPAQAISAALSDRLSNYDVSDRLRRAIRSLQSGSTYNYVIFDPELIEVTGVNGQPVSQEMRDEVIGLDAARVGIWNRPKPEGYVKGGINTAAHKWDRRIYKMLEASRGSYAKYVKRAEMFVRDINVLSKEFNVPPEQINAALGSTDNRLAAADIEQIKQIKKRGLAAAQGVYMSARNLAKQYDAVQDFAQAALVRQEAKKQFDLNVQTYKKAAENYEARARKRIADEARVARHAALDALPKPVAEKVAEMRATIDQLSARMIAEGGLSSEIQATISNNMELWLHRSYQIFDDPNYAEWLREQKDPEAIKLRNQTVNFIRQDLEARKTAELVSQGMTQTAAKAQAKIEVTDLHVQQTFDDYLLVADKGSKTLLTGATVSKEVSALMKRGVIPEEIQKLWGRYDDPKVNLAKSIGAVAQHLAIHKFYEDVVALGTREGWLIKDEPSAIKYDPQGNRLVELLPNNGMTGRYGGTPDARYAPLAGYLGPKDLRDALAQTIEDSGGHRIMRFFQQLTGYSMASKTVLSWQSGMRNYSGNALPTFLNGNINVFTKEGREAFARGHALAWGNLWNKADNKIDRAYLERLAELGVTGDGVTYNLVRDLTGGFDSNSKATGLMGVLSRKLVFPHVLVKGAKKGYDMAGKGYNFPDEIWKVINFEMEKSRLKEILPGESADVIERRAADIVRNTMPTYSRAPEWVKVIRKFPFIAPFITFPVEMMRVTIGQVKVGLDFIAEGKESGNAAMTKAGYHRLLTLGANAAVIGSLPILARTLFGFSKDDEDDLRKHLAPWEQNVTLLLLDSADPAEAINYLNVSYMNPYDVWLRPVRAAQRGFRDPNTSVYENLRNAAAEFFDPIAKEQILFGSIIDTRRGVTASGTRVWDKTDSDEVKFGKSIRHIYNSALEPGTITSAERIWKGLTGQVTGSGRAYSGWQEGMSAVFGMKAQSVDVSSTLGYAAKDFQGARLDATAAFNRVFKSRGTQKDEVIIANYQSANEKLRDTYRVLYEKTVAAVRLGTMTRAEAMKLLRAEGLTAEAIGDIFNNRFRRYTPSRESLNEARDRGAALNQDRIGLYRQALETVPPVQPISEDDFF